MNRELHQRTESSSTIHSRKIHLLDGRDFIISLDDIPIVELDTGRVRHIQFGWLKQESAINRSLFRVLSNLFSTHSISYAVTSALAIKTWHEKGWKSNDELVLQDLELLTEMPKSYQNFVTPTLRKIVNSDLPGLSEDLKEWLNNGYKFEEAGNGQYFSLISNDPERGALTDQEIHNLHNALNRAYDSGRINPEAFTLAWMVIGTGLRPIQIARMHVADVLVHSGPEEREVTLKISLAKGEKSSQTEYWMRRAPTVLADCLVNYLDKVKVISTPDDYLFLANESTRDIGRYVRKIFHSLDTWSDRLEGPIPITPYRFRYTLATRALRQGASDYEVARLLTHRSTSCIQYYRASMPELQQPINTAIGKEMDYFARAFQGKLIRSLDEATFPDDGEQQILDFIHLTGQTLGACGTRTECHLNAPVACLSCHRFEPLEEAPWEELLEKLKEDQAMEKEERIRQINHNAMSSIVEIMALRDKREASPS